MLIAGPNVYICDECVDICWGILDAREDHERAQSATWSARSPVVCSLCGTPTPLEACLSVHERGVLCPGCISEIQASIEEQKNA